MLRELLEKCNTQLEDMQAHDSKQNSDRKMMSQALIQAEQEILALKKELETLRADSATFNAESAALLANSAESQVRRTEVGVQANMPPSSPVSFHRPRNVPMSSQADSQTKFMVVQAHPSPSPRSSQHQSPRVVPAVTKNMSQHMPHPSSIAHTGAPPGLTLPIKSLGAAHLDRTRMERDPQRNGSVARAGEQGANIFGRETPASDALSPHIIGEAM